MENKEKLIEIVYNYLCYDLKSDNRWHDPSSKNEHWLKVKMDAENITNLIIKENTNNVIDLIYEKINDRLTNEMSPQFKEIFEQAKIK